VSGTDRDPRKVGPEVTKTAIGARQAFESAQDFRACAAVPGADDKLLGVQREVAVEGVVDMLGDLRTRHHHGRASVAAWAVMFIMV
jgi:hypothetical protein